MTTNISDLPLEVQWKYLYHLPCASVLKQFSASKIFNESCNEPTFWRQYFSDKSSRYINDCLEYISNKSQQYIITAHEGVPKDIKISYRAKIISLFNSIMRDHKQGVKYFVVNDLSLTNHEIKNIKVSIIDVISIINNRKYEDEILLEKTFETFHSNITLFRYLGEMIIIELIVNHLEVQAIRKIFIASEDCPDYNVFIGNVIINLSIKGYVELLIPIMKKVKTKINKYTKKYYNHVAEFLPLKLFDYINDELKINLVEYIEVARDIKRFQYWLKNSNLIGHIDIMNYYNIAYLFLSAKSYIASIYQTTTSQQLKDRNVMINVEDARNSNQEKDIKWADDVEKLWSELQDGEDCG